MVLHISQCQKCFKDKLNCEYFKTIRNAILPIQPRHIHVRHNCQDFYSLFKIGDIVNVSTEVAFEKYECYNGYSYYEKVDTIPLEGRGKVIDIARNGKILVRMDNEELVNEIVEGQANTGCGVYGKIRNDNEDFEFMRGKGFPFWLYPREVLKITPENLETT